MDPKKLPPLDWFREDDGEIIIGHSETSLTKEEAMELISIVKRYPAMVEALEKWSEYMALVKDAASRTLESKEAWARHRKIDELEGQAWELTQAALKGETPQ